MLKKLLLIYFLFLSATQTLFSQIKFERRLIAYDYNVDSLKNRYGNHKQFLNEFELQCLIALSGYPELKDDNISFRYRKINTSGKTTLLFLSVFKQKNRHYIMYINNDESGKVVLLKDAPFNAQIGLIAHELGHIADFRKRRTSGLITWGLNYLSRKKRIICERRTDSIAIEHGFGWQLFDWIDFVLNGSNATEDYKTFKKRYYLQPNEIFKIIETEYQ